MTTESRNLHNLNLAELIAGASAELNAARAESFAACARAADAALKVLWAEKKLLDLVTGEEHHVIFMGKGLWTAPVLNISHKVVMRWSEDAR
jgi:hypothetical protein